MPNEKRKIKEIGKKELDAVVGGVGAFTNNFAAQFCYSGFYTRAADGITYTGGMDIANPTSKGNYAMISVTPAAGGLPQAGWNFKFGFPDQAWANSYAGGAADFKAAFLTLYGSAKWKGWGSSTQIYYG